VVVTVLSYLLDKERKESKRVSDNQTALITGLEYRRTKDSREIASAYVMKLDRDEYKRLYKQRGDTIKDMGYKLSRVKSEQEIKTETNHQIKVPIKDHTLPNNLITPCFNYSSPFLDVTGCVIDSTLHAEIRMRADLQIIAHRVPKQWWFIKWGTKAVKVDVISKDKNCSITHNRYIELK
jgi:hypothetical protein